MRVRIGIPRTLAYYAFYPWWQTFLEEIGLEVVPSEPTTKAILDAGVGQTVSDACIPIKLFHGHVINLKDRVDCIFVPRMVSVRKLGTETFCPKFLGLPDLIRASMNDLPELVDIRVDLKRRPLELFRSCQIVGRKFGAGFRRVTRAYCRAAATYRRYTWLLRQGLTHVEAMENLQRHDHGQAPAATAPWDYQLTFAVLGYPYTVYDRFVNVDLIKKLRALKVRVVTVEMVSCRHLLREARRMPKNLFWHFSNQVLHAASYFLNRQRVDGIIHVTAFGCGPDAMVGRLMELKAKQQGHIPFMSVTIDEHTGEGGIQTRVEAFVDMLKRRRGLD